jgi:hypothetical protein
MTLMAAIDDLMPADAETAALSWGRISPFCGFHYSQQRESIKSCGVTYA